MPAAPDQLDGRGTTIVASIPHVVREFTPHPLKLLAYESERVEP